MKRTIEMKRLLGGFFSLAFSVFVSSTVQAASYEFTWTGSNGYRLEGALSIPDNLAKSTFIDESAIECFWIQGFHRDEPVGAWSIRQLMAETTWTLKFEPKNLRFRTSGSGNQEWNMNGTGRGCGKDGFGFHAGSAAQDICIDNRLIRSSEVPSETPLKARRNDRIKFKVSQCVYLPIS